MNAYIEKSKFYKQERFKVWLEQSFFDLDAAEVSLSSGSFEWVCYQSIQAVEKALKSVIVFSGYIPPKTHKLGVLVSMCNRANPNFIKIKLDFRQIEGFTFISRYPFLIPGRNVTPRELITKDDASTCIKIANDILEKISEFLKKPGHFSKESIRMEDFYYTKEEIDKRKADLVMDIMNCEKLQTRKIILFGGFAREQSRPRSSTMDILVVAETELSFIERIQYVRVITRGSEPIIEPLIYTPSEFDFMLKEEGEGYLESAISEGVVLWESPNP